MRDFRVNLELLADYIQKYDIPKIPNKRELFDLSLKSCTIDGLYLEFGVFKGGSITFIASRCLDKIIYGFDSFNGLPEQLWDGHGSKSKGIFKLDYIPDLKINVYLVVGMFQDTLEPFLRNHTDDVSFIHMDADLYSSTKYVLYTLAEYDRLQKGTVIQFDEIFWVLPEDGRFDDSYLGFYKQQSNRYLWYQGEFIALQELVDQYDIKYKWLGYCKNHASIIIE